MRLRLRFFAAAREAMGQSALPFELSEGATVGDLLAQLRQAYPRFAALPSEMMVSVNREYRGPDYPLHEGDEVAFIPPVSGGAALGVALGSRPQEELANQARMGACSRSRTRC